MVKGQLEKKNIEISSLTDRLEAHKSSLEEAEQRASTAEAIVSKIIKLPAVTYALSYSVTICVCKLEVHCK